MYGRGQLARLLLLARLPHATRQFKDQENQDNKKAAPEKDIYIYGTCTNSKIECATQRKRTSTNQEQHGAKQASKMNPRKAGSKQ